MPPTPERVKHMLGATRRAPQAVVATVAPGFGTATVEAMAINAVMAGCRPEHFPVLIAALEAATQRSFNLQGIQATTNPVAPWIIVNGPIARTLGINSGMNCLGQGTRANATIGRALRLILQNIGGALPGEGGQPWLVMSPEHADIMKRGGLTKYDVKRRLWEESKMAASRFAVKDYVRARHTRCPELGEIGPETLLPISADPEGVGIIVAGGPGTHSVYVPTFGQTRAVTRLIDAKADEAR